MRIYSARTVALATGRSREDVTRMLRGITPSGVLLVRGQKTRGYSLSSLPVKFVQEISSRSGGMSEEDFLSSREYFAKSNRARTSAQWRPVAKKLSAEAEIATIHAALQFLAGLLRSGKTFRRAKKLTADRVQIQIPAASRAALLQRLSRYWKRWIAGNCKATALLPRPKPGRRRRLNRTAAEKRAMARQWDAERRRKKKEADIYFGALLATENITTRKEK